MSHPFDEKTYVATKGSADLTKNVFDGKTQVVRGEITASSKIDLGEDLKVRRRPPMMWILGGACAVILVIAFGLLRSNGKADVEMSPAVVESPVQAGSPPAAAPVALPAYAPVAARQPDATAVQRMNKGDVFQLIKLNLSKNRGPAATPKGF